MSREADCEKIVRETRRAFGAIHILVNNAGVYGPVRPVEKVDPREWDRVIAVNLRGPFLLSRLVLPEMYERGSGAILNIVSIAAKAAFPLNSAYAASKAGLIGLTHTLAAEGGAEGRARERAKPGPGAGDENVAGIGEAIWPSIFRRTETSSLPKMFEGILQGRPQTADEIASAALFLVSDQASAITGQTLNVDGGMAFY